MKKTVKNRQTKISCWNAIGVWSDVQDKCELLSEHIHCRNCPVFSVEGKRVLDRGAPVGYLKDWRKTLAEKKKEKIPGTESVLVFKVVDEWFAIPADCLEEVSESRTIHRIPRNKNPDISGVVNIGGEVRVCYSLKSIFNVKEPDSDSVGSESSSVGRLIVALLGGKHYVFTVDHVSGLSWYSDKDMAQAPATLENNTGNMLLGVINQNDNNVAVLNVDMFVDGLERITL